MILLASAILRTVLVGVDSPPCPPNFERLRYNEDYACLEEDDASVLPKRLNLGSIYSLTVGGELRQRLTYVKNFEFGASQTNGDWYNTQRYFVHLDQRLFRDLQVFVQVGSLVQVDLETGPSPIERNDFDLLQGFARYDAGWLRPWAGRRVLQFGSQRLVSRREGPNVRRTFDGAGFEFDSEWLQGHLFLSREVEVRPDGIFNDWETTSPELWGTYFTAPVRLGSLDIYYLGTHFESASYARGEGPEDRHSFGARWFGERAEWDWDLEGIFQTGTFGEDTPIRAWTVASTTGYTLADIEWQPRLAVSANIASGDGDGGRLTAFSALFPRGNYFSEAAVLGPRNFYNAHAFLTIAPTAGWSHTVDVNWYWRLRDEDGVYGPPGNVILNSGGGGQLVTTAISNGSSWTFNRYFDASAIYTIQAHGELARAQGSPRNTHFVELTLRARY